MMRLPFISRRTADFVKGLVRIQLQWEQDNHAETREVLSETQRRLSAALAGLAQERAKRERLKAYMLRSHSGRYETRLARALRAVAYERKQAEGYRRTIRQLTDQLLDATGHGGEELLPAERRALDLDKEDA